MRRRIIAAAGGALAVVTVGVALAHGHDLFLRPRDFVVRVGAVISVRVLNGTFTTSESAVTSDRLRDLGVAGPAGVAQLDRATWTATGKESGWRVPTSAAGTYLLGASLAPRSIRLTAAQFNGYLREEGLVDVIAERRAGGTLEQPAHERYGKHVKALVRATSDDMPAAAADTAFRHAFGYPAELVALDDPYRLRSGGLLRVRALVDGAPVANQVVLAGGRTPSGARRPLRTMRTDAGGVAVVRLDARGTWYLSFIRMVPVPAASGDSVNYESKWATLTFARP